MSEARIAIKAATRTSAIAVVCAGAVDLDRIVDHLIRITAEVVGSKVVKRGFGVIGDGTEHDFGTVIVVEFSSDEALEPWVSRIGEALKADMPEIFTG